MSTTKELLKRVQDIKKKNLTEMSDDDIIFIINTALQSECLPYFISVFQNELNRRILEKLLNK